MAIEDTFRYEYEYSEVPESEVLDSRGNKVTTIKCHGKLLAGNTGSSKICLRSSPFLAASLSTLAMWITSIVPA
jgi:hypothetical protein